ncbi:MAG TPA: multiheme c-type cytochrome [Thermoanaerobaculia bacterium]|nr:multiheme c-type cytochrome [Thermoanaerobaculia bacterium]
MTQTAPTPAPSARRRPRKAVGDRLRKVLFVVLGLFALLAVNAVYLTGVRVLEAVTGQTYQNWFYLAMFLFHLVLGAAILIPFIVFGFAHVRNTHDRRNRRAVKVGWALLVVALVLLASGVVLTRIEGVFEVKDPAVRSVALWAHILTPLAAAWLFVIHRLAGPKIRWHVGLRWAVVAAVFGGIMLVLQAQDPRRWNVEGPASGERYFFPSLARTATGDFIPERVLMNDQYCVECHADIHQDWSYSMHRFSSFNNPAYLFSVRETRQVALERDGNLQASRWCAGCHDPVVFFSGRFDDPEFDDVNDPTGQAGITCTVCHAITHVNSPRGNSDYTIEEPLHYPFAFSENQALRWVNEQLVKSKPELHKKTFLKPLHQSTEFCATCHKVHLPPELNNYKWLRGQNHYDAFLLSGVSGHGITSFYYPPEAEANCNGCHMKPMASDDFGARRIDSSGELQVHRHLFPSANTAIPALLGFPAWVNEEHRKFNEGVMRVDIFGLREGGTVEGALTAPIRPQIPELVPGRSYLLETVIRTLKMGHLFTQGTADSNEVWLDVTVTSGGRVIGRSGGFGAGNEVDPWSHFVNVYMLDRYGNRIDRRNAQDIFVPLYNHQIPPGAGSVVHYRLEIPPGVAGPVTVDLALRYRKFDTTYMRKVMDDPEWVNTLPVMTLAEDRVVFPVAGAGGELAPSAPPPEPEWQRWNDYGIGLLLKAGSKSRGELRQAEEAFLRVEELGRPDGPLNLARVYLEQGTVEDQAIAALERAATFDPPAPAWSVAWFTGLVNKQNGFLDEAIANFESVVNLSTEETRARGFDFSVDYRLQNELGQTLFERAKAERGPAREEARRTYLERAVVAFERALAVDPESATAHFNLDLVLRQLGRDREAEEHRALYLRYKDDDNARDRAIAIARAADPAADRAADAIVIYDLRRPGAYGLDAPAGGSAHTAALGGMPGGG